jgi:hypothetical protein
LGCDKNGPIEGLWIVKAVKVGDEEMTPNARWTRFNSDSTFESGNGWYQHTIGTWKLLDGGKKLLVENEKGLVDPYDPFSIRIKNDTMHWSRIEDGQKTKITLERSDNLPKSFSDKVLGLWKLEKAEGAGLFFNHSENLNTNDYLFLRWDKRFIISSSKGRINGVYNVNAHRPELELIPYGNIKREFWAIIFNKETITLELLNSEEQVKRTFRRSNRFPE